MNDFEFQLVRKNLMEGLLQILYPHTYAIPFSTIDGTRGIQRVLPFSILEKLAQQYGVPERVVEGTTGGDDEQNTQD